MHAEEIEIWTLPDGVRCVMREHQPGWMLVLARNHQILKADTFADAHLAIAAADEWRQRYEHRSSTSPTDDM